MVRVVPTEEGADVSSSLLPSQGKEIPRKDVTADQQPTSDDPAEDQLTISTCNAGASAEEDDQRLSCAVSDATKTGSDVELSPPTSTDPSRKPSESEEMRHEEPKLESGVLAPVESGSGVTDNNTKDDLPTLDMDKHSGMTTFSLMRQDDEPSLDGPDARLSTHTEQEGDEENTTEKLMEAAEENEEEDSELGLPRLVRNNTGIARKFVRQNTGIGTQGGASAGRKKKASFRVPQTMYMGHPVGSPAAEFMERQQHRLAEIKTRRQEVAGLLELVMEHNPNSTGSVLPDIDAVFPDQRGREKSQGDWCV